MSEIEYSDGAEQEEEVVTFLRDHPPLKSHESAPAELTQSWPLRYHLSPERANLLRHLDFSGRDVLELGGGMGGVSRFLAEKSRRLTIIEGTQRRAQGITARLRDCDNWNLVVGNIESTILEDKFDVVVVIGVLEYSELFVDAGEHRSPFHAFLQKARSFLRPDGVLVLAIENRLGLKYWSGCPEDHTALLFDGICGYPRTPSPKTFARAELQALLGESGFQNVSEFYAAPDYKVPATIISEALTRSHPILAAELFTTRPFESYGLPRAHYFPDTLATVSLGDAGLLPEFANSFLFVADQSGTSILSQLTRSESQEVAWHYTTDRLLPTETVFRQRGGALTVEKRTALGTQSKIHGPVLWRASAEAPVSSAASVANALQKKLYSGDAAGFEKLIDCFLTWSLKHWASGEKLDPKALDAIFRNALMLEGGAFELFDLEWVSREPVEPSFFVFRNFFNLVGDIQLLATLFPVDSLASLYERTCGRLGVVPHLNESISSEAELQAAVHGVNETVSRQELEKLFSTPLDMWPGFVRSSTAEHDVRVTIRGLNSAIDDFRRRLTASDAQSAQTKTRLAQTERQIDDIDLAVRKTVADELTLLSAVPIADVSQVAGLVSTKAPPQELVALLVGVLKRKYDDLLAQATARAEHERQIAEQGRLQLRLRDEEMRNLHSSRAFRIGQQLSWAFGDVKRAVQRSKLFVSDLTTRRDAILLKPLADVEKLPNQNGATSWKATGVDPQFLLETRVGVTTAGWVEFRAQASGHGFAWAPKLYFDVGGGFSERSCASLPQPIGGEIVAKIMIPHGTLRLRFDPGDLPGVFIFDRLSLQPVYGDIPERELLPAEAVVSESAYSPLISVVCVGSGDAPFLRQTIDSLRGQLYENWELCLVDCTSSDSSTHSVVERYAKADSRIKMAGSAPDESLAAALTRALSLAGGEFIALIQPQDELAANALSAIVGELRRHREADIIYSDEDLIDSHEQYVQPQFKPDWNPDYFLAANYVGHVCAIRRRLLVDVGGIRSGFNGAEHFDLLLRCITKTAPENIRHLSSILYHRRSVTDSSSVGIEARKHALQAWSANQGARVEIEVGELPSTFHLRYPLPDPVPLASIVIPTKDKADLLRSCIESIRNKTTYPNYEIVIVDNGSQEKSAQSLLAGVEASGQARVLRYDKPFNYSAINNFAVSRCRGDVIVLLNNDIEVIGGDWLTEMVSLALRPKTGAVGAKLLYADGSVQHAGVILGSRGIAAHAHHAIADGDPGYFGRALVRQNLSAVTAACLAIRRELYEAVHGLDERLAVAFNDVDFCLRVQQAGYRNVWTPFAKLYHFESKSRGVEDTPEKRQRFQGECDLMQRRWSFLLLNDPAYNPNLSLDDKPFALAEIPRVPAPVLSQATLVLDRKIAALQKENRSMSERLDSLSHRGAEMATRVLKRVPLARQSVITARRLVRSGKARWSKLSAPRSGLRVFARANNGVTTASRIPNLDPYLSATNEDRIKELGDHSVLALPKEARRRGVSVIILNLNKPELIIPLLTELVGQQRRLMAQAGLHFEVIVGDTGSTDPAVLDYYSQHSSEIVVVRNLHYHFSRCNNLLARRASCDTLLFLNNDIVLPAGTDAILAMFQHLAETPSSGAVGPVLFFPDHNVQHGGIGFFSEASYRGFCHHVDPPMPINEGHWWFARIGAVTGAFLMVRANDFFTVGCMDENYAAECQDVALCLALDRRGLSSVVAYCGDLVHLENGTRPKGEESWRDRQRFIRKWSGYIEARFL